MNSGITCYNHSSKNTTKIGMNMRKFVAQMKAILKKNKYHLVLVKNNYVYDSGNSCCGWTDESIREVRVAVNNSPRIWIPVLAHEVGHVIQVQEKHRSWVALNNEPLHQHTLFDEWLAENIELKKKTSQHLVKLIQANELDCERRTVRMLMDWKLPFDRKSLIQEANACIYLYSMYWRRRKWHKKNLLPEELILKMPTKFLAMEKYWEIPRSMVKQFDKLVFN